MKNITFKRKGFSVKEDEKTPVYPVISECPVCQHDLYVTELECENCHTKLNGVFSLSKFNYLDTDKLFFIEIFMKNRGNIKAVEKELKVSYPTVKKLLAETITALGYTPNDGDDEDEETDEEDKEELASKSDILEKIKNGELSVDDATDLLKKAK